MNKNMFALLPTSDNESDVEVKVDKTPHPGNPVSKTRFNACQSDWETDDAVGFEIKDKEQHVVKKSPKKDSPKKDSPKEKSGIVPFKGVKCVPLNSVSDDDFPKLGATSPTPSTSSSKSGKSKSRRQHQKNVITFTIDNSYIDEKRRQRQSNHGYNHGRFQQREDPRTAAFAKMEDKEAMAKSLTCTRACKNVTNRQENGEHGVCYRDTCSFAHSLDELNDPMCGFDATCRFRYGRPRRDGTVDAKGKCMFRHTNETREDWLKRTGRKLPALPQTSEKTHKPVARKEKHSTHRPQQEKKEKKALGSGYTAKTNLATPATKITLTTPSAPRKIIWGKPVPENVAPVTPVSSPGKSRTLTPKRLELSSDESSSDSRNYRKRSYHRRRRKRSRSPKTRRESKPETQIIRVPTQELAKMAIQAAFDHGVYNIQVLVE